MKRFGILLALLATGSAAATECILRQTTAGFVRTPAIYDSTDHVTPETATIDNLAVTIAKANATTFTAKAETTDCTHMGGGVHHCPIGSGDSNVRGSLYVQIVVSGWEPVNFECNVMAQDMYDAMYGPDDGITLATTQPYYTPATATALADLQADVDLLAAPGGVVLAASQPNYAPSTQATLDAGFAAAQADLDTLTGFVGSNGYVLDSTQPNYQPATVAALAAAQTDLDTLTAGVTLAASQPLYTPSTASQVTTLQGAVDAIKAITDQMVFGVANLLNVNVVSINECTVTGTPTGSKWSGSC